MDTLKPSALFARLRNRLRYEPAAQAAYRLLNWHLRLQFRATPWSVSLETNGPCNRKCSYCPVSQFERTGEMPRELFEKIINDLATVGFRRTLTFHFYNEPLLDPRLPDLVRYARSRLPDCMMDVFTNGDYLTRTWIDDLFGAGIQVIRVSLHSASSEAHLRKILVDLDDETRRKIEIDSFFDREETGGFLYNRLDMAASSTNSVATAKGTGCSQANSLAINLEGQTALCCNDFFAANGHGSLAATSVADVWRRSRPIRKRIYLGYFDKPICQVCNVGATRSLAAEQVMLSRSYTRDSMALISAKTDAE